MEGLSFLIFAVLVITSVAAWINTKIILEEINKIKKHLGIPEDKPFDFQKNPIDNDKNNKDQ